MNGFRMPVRSNARSTVPSFKGGRHHEVLVHQQSFRVLSNSLATPADMKYGCRVVNYKGTLFCSYIADGEDEHVSFITKPSAASWSAPVEIGIESLSGPPAIFVFNNKLYVLCSGQHHPRELSVSAKLGEYDDLSGGFNAIDFPIQFSGGPSVVEHNGGSICSTRCQAPPQCCGKPRATC